MIPPETPGRTRVEESSTTGSGKALLHAARSIWAEGMGCTHGVIPDHGAEMGQDVFGFRMSSFEKRNPSEDSNEDVVPGRGGPDTKAD